MTKMITMPGTIFSAPAECGYCGNRGHTQDECRRKHRQSARVAANIAFEAVTRPDMANVIVERKKRRRV